MLDLRWLLFGDHNNIAKFATKAAAVAAANNSGGKWRPSDAFRAYNRFCIFWLVGQVFPDDMILMTKDGTSTVVKFPGRYA